MKNPRTHLTVIEGGRDELERQLILTLFTPYLPDNALIGKQIAEKLKPRISAASLTLFSQQPPRR